MQPVPPCSASACWWWLWALRVAVRHIICGGLLFIYFSSRLCCPLRFQDFPQTHRWECFLVFGNFSLRLLPGMDLHPYLFCLSFYLLYFVLPPFEDTGLLFLGAWCPLPAFRSCSVEFALHSMIFRWLCGGESGLPILFLRHLRPASLESFLDLTFYHFHCGYSC